MKSQRKKNSTRRKYKKTQNRKYKKTQKAGYYITLGSRENVLNKIFEYWLKEVQTYRLYPSVNFNCREMINLLKKYTNREPNLSDFELLVFLYCKNCISKVMVVKENKLYVETNANERILIKNLNINNLKVKFDTFVDAAFTIYREKILKITNPKNKRWFDNYENEKWLKVKNLLYDKLNELFDEVIFLQNENITQQEEREEEQEEEQEEAEGDTDEDLEKRDSLINERGSYVSDDDNNDFVSVSSVEQENNPTHEVYTLEGKFNS